MLGDNDTGQLGNGTTSSDTPVEIAPTMTWGEASAGGGHTCTIASDGTLWCWGYNNDGQVGDGTTTERDAPTQIGTATWSEAGAGTTLTSGLQT